MKKVLAFTLALGLSSTAFATDLSGDGTSHVRLEGKSSSMTRSAVVSKVQSANVANSMDSTVAPDMGPASKASRSEVVKKMEGYKFADFGDGTNPTPWEKTKSDNRNLALDGNTKKGASTN
ncbi:MAG TPA: hypothetical protein VFV28_06520 [Limnobacter sp.]|nr:hypothetical protein [Limnobacter sp.]